MSSRRWLYSFIKIFSSLRLLSYQVTVSFVMLFYHRIIWSHWSYPVLKLQNFAWGDAFAALTKFQWRLCNSVPAIEWRPKKKGLRRKLKCFFPEIRWIPKKKGLHRSLGLYRPEFVRFIRAGWLFFVWTSSAPISMGGRLNLDEGTLNLDGGALTLDGGTRSPASPLQFKYWSYLILYS